MFSNHLFIQLDFVSLISIWVSFSKPSSPSQWLWCFPDLPGVTHLTRKCYITFDLLLQIGHILVPSALDRKLTMKDIVLRIKLISGQTQLISSGNSSPNSVGLFSKFIIPFDWWEHSSWNFVLRSFVQF